MTSADDYIDAHDEPRRSELRTLHELIRATLPTLEVQAGAKQGIGYGPFHYRYASGHEGDAFQVSLVARKAAISLYVLSVVDGDYLAPRYAERLPKASIGKSCVRIKRVADIDLEALAELLREAGRYPPPGA